MEGNGALDEIEGHSKGKFAVDGGGDRLKSLVFRTIRYTLEIPS